MQIKPGFYHMMSMDTYHGHRESYSRSTLIEFKRSPAHCKAYREKKEEKSKDIFNLGTAGHSAILEGLDAYLKAVAVIPEDVLGKNGSRSTNAYKAWSAEHAGKVQLLQEQVDQVRGMYQAVMKKQSFQKYLSKGNPEVSAFWYEEYNGHKILCKNRPDFLPAPPVGPQVVFDLKTTSLAMEDWPRYAANAFYHWSSYWTCRGLTKLTGQPHAEYLFGVVETTPPHDCQIFRTPEILFDLAQVQIERILPYLIDCDRKDEWPGSPDKVVDLEFPRWALKDLPEEYFFEAA